ncbi:MAG: hypothetical protein MUO63_09890 [Desulfobulbaceae bacterium]|nr:hypothetical protein [Desulfobulbaceae bacterium]
MKTINRTVLLITPKQPYIDWANSFDDSGPTMSSEELRHTAILIPDAYDEYNYENWLKKNNKDIFLMELESWMVVPESYPKMTYKVFKEWFEVRVADATIDMGKGPVELEEY